ncbi:MAG: cytochrome B [Gammaproteobacteria bacterium RIFCSPLOWO2_02_FULL_52_10]|nr:MAG: cytochrome B [Gammaproteobacteria bacterium RIFCSPLOWO2_02_FULL_52_10]
MMQTLYDWMMVNAAGRNARTILFIVSFAESSFFPIIPDVMLIPMMLADRKQAFRLAAWCTLASVLGGILGYGIGVFLYDSVGKWLISLYGYGDKVDEFRAFYAEWGAWVILVKGVSPIPYKVVTIMSGFAAYSFPMFMLLSIITRGARFTLWAILLYIYGEPIREFIEKRLELVLFATFITIMIGFLLATYLI